VSPLPRVSKPIEPTTGRKETHTTSRSAALNRSTDLSPWPCRQLACLRAHAYTDTNEEPTTRHSSSKIGHPTTQSPSGTRMEARTALLVLRSTPRPRRLIPSCKGESVAHRARKNVFGGTPTPFRRGWAWARAGGRVVPNNSERAGGQLESRPPARYWFGAYLL